MSIENILQSGNYHLIDVREPIELEMDGAIDQATNIPLGEIEEHTDQIANMSGPKIVFCRSGNRSGKAMEYLKSQGIEDVYNGGGYQEVASQLEK